MHGGSRTWSKDGEGGKRSGEISMVWLWPKAWRKKGSEQPQGLEYHLDSWVKFITRYMFHVRTSRLKLRILQ